MMYKSILLLAVSLIITTSTLFADQTVEMTWAQNPTRLVTTTPSVTLQPGETLTVSIDNPYMYPWIHGGHYEAIHDPVEKSPVFAPFHYQPIVFNGNNKAPGIFTFQGAAQPQTASMNFIVGSLPYDCYGNPVPGYVPQVGSCNLTVTVE